MNHQEIITLYLSTVDESLEELSKNHEGKISNLPSWVLCKRKIDIGTTNDNEGVVIKITPDDSLEGDLVNILEINALEDVNKITSPMFLTGLPNSDLKDNFTLIADLSIDNANNPISIPAIDNKFMLGWGRTSGFDNTFNEHKAKEDAINLWNSALNGLKSKSSFVREVRNVLEKFQAIIKRKAFLERRIHRFINEHKSIFLPEHKTCLYDHKLYLKGDMRKADFVLEREQGLPSILIELESPVHRVFTRKGDLTAESNHASQQVAEWVKYIENEPQTNAVGDYSSKRKNGRNRSRT